MNKFNDPYGILALSAIKDLAEGCNAMDENPFMEENCNTILPVFNQSPLIQELIKTPIKPLLTNISFLKGMAG